MRCAVKNCNNNNRSKNAKPMSYFNFPSDASLLKEWVNFCCRGNEMNVKTSHICMEHFAPEYFENSLKYEMGFTKRRLLKRNAVPTIRKFYSSEREKRLVERSERQEKKRVVEELLKEENASKRQEKRENKRIAEKLIKEDNSALQSEDSSESHSMPEERGFPEEQDFEEIIFNPAKDETAYLRTELQRLRKENVQLKETILKRNARIKALEKKLDNDAKLYEDNIDTLKTLLAEANSQLNVMEEKILDMFAKGKHDESKNFN